MDPVRLDVECCLRDELDLRVAGWTPLAGGTQNRLFRLEMENGPPLVAKLYHRDRWNRLQREFGALSLLGQLQVRQVPRAILKKDAESYGVYSFEPGSSKPASEFAERELVEIARFAAALERVTPDRGELETAVGASFCVADHFKEIDGRLRAFEEFAASPDVYPEVRGLCREVDVRARLTELFARETAGLSDADRAAALPRSAWGLNTGDFCSVNFLIDADGSLTVIDFESSGWDDPARQVMGFVAHAASEDLPPGGVHTFLAAYADVTNLSSENIARYERIGSLLDLEWVAIYATATLPGVVATKQFADADFDRHTFLTGVIDRLKTRLARASERTGYSFSA